MPCTAEIHIGDVGTSFRATVYDQDSAIVNLSAYSTLQIIFLKPNRTSTTVTATLYTDGTDGIMEYITQSSSFLDQSGIWKLQGIVTIGSTDVHRSNIETFTVYPNI